MAEPDLVHHPSQWLTIRYPRGIEFDEIQTYVGPIATEEEQAGAVGQRDPDLFLLTESYLTFVQKSKLLAFGRRGTGKTAMVFQLLDEVRSGRHPDYLCGTVISQDQYLQRLVTRVAEGGLTHYSDNVLIERFAEEWRRVLKVHALRAVLEWAAEHQVDNRAAGRIRLFFHGHRAMRPLLDALNRRRRPTDPAHLAEAVLAVARDLDSAAAGEAFDALHELAADNDRAILVMADSPDNFSWTDPLTRLALSGLIEAARSLYAEGPEVVPKLTLPAELYPHLIFMNPGKSAPQTVFLLWQYHHLLTLLAKRWHAYVECGGRHLDTTLLAGLSDVNEATRYLYERIPGQLTTRHGVVFPVLPYTVRHTQKKPRQLIEVWNAILTRVDGRPERLTDATIRDGVQLALPRLVDETINMYDKIIQHTGSVLHSALAEQYVYFNYGELIAFLNRAESRRAVAGFESKEEVIRLLLEIGAMGRFEEESPLPRCGKLLMQALFEYQVKGVVNYHSKTWFVLHPMFFEKLTVQADSGRFIYPVAAESVERTEIDAVLD